MTWLDEWVNPLDYELRAFEAHHGCLSELPFGELEFVSLRGRAVYISDEGECRKEEDRGVHCGSCTLR